MATKKKPTKNTFPLTTFFSITTIILGIIAGVLFNRVEVLESETHDLVKQHNTCKQSLYKLKDCPKELDRTQEYQAEVEGKLEREKTKYQIEVDSLKKVLIASKQSNSMRKSSAPRRSSKRTTRSMEDYVASSQISKEFESKYQERVMTDVLRVSVKQ